jgi:hypothetical protein
MAAVKEAAVTVPTAKTTKKSAPLKTIVKKKVAKKRVRVPAEEGVAHEPIQPELTPIGAGS